MLCQHQVIGLHIPQPHRMAKFKLTPENKRLSALIFKGRQKHVIGKRLTIGTPVLNANGTTAIGRNRLLELGCTSRLV